MYEIYEKSINYSGKGLMSLAEYQRNLKTK